MTDFELYEYSENKLKEAKKRIAELEAEVNRLKLNEQLAVKNGKNLLKENAELKEKQKWLGSSTKCWFSNSPCRSCDEHDERLRRLGLCYIGQLTKATGIIKDMLSILPKGNIEGIYEITEEAEQFLNEVEK